MPNKKASRNAYFFFVLDMMPELKRRGLEVSGVREAIPLCSEYWALLSVEEKEKYSEKAREYKNKPLEPTHPRDFPDNWGQREEPRKEMLYAQGDNAQVASLYKQNKGLDQNVFYFLNIFSHGEMPVVCEQRFVPCEIGCVRYSLRDGIMGSFHEFIDPGELPRGFRYHCQNGSAATHQIPISGFELANNDYHNMFRSLCDFVMSAPGMKAPVYCKAADAYRIKWCLQWLARKAGMENKFELNEAESLIINLYKEKLEEEPSRASVGRMLDVVHWDYASNTRCKWHEDNDMWCCALASCKKITYCISKALASVYGITITSAHLPSNDVASENHPGNAKIIVLDAKRFQKQINRDSSNHVGTSELPSKPRGLQPSQGSIGRGRGILRLLESFAISQSSG